jgi:hypothetical protein
LDKGVDDMQQDRYFSYRLDYLKSEQYAELRSSYDDPGKKLWKFY